MIHNLKLIATNVAGSANASTTVAVAEPAGLPAWLSGVTVRSWTQVPNTTMLKMDKSGLEPIIGTSAGTDWAKYGHPFTSGGIMSQSGGTMRTNGSELLLFGGGGAGSWAGNDIRGLRLEDDAPQWKVRRPPSPDYWPRVNTGGVSHVYMQDGVSPNSRHSYFGPQYCNAQERFYIFACWQVWETDTRPPSPGSEAVDSLEWSTRIWNPPGTHAPIPTAPGWDSSWTVKHPVTEHFYKSAWRYIHRFDPFANKWHAYEYTHPSTDVDRAVAGIDPDHNLILTVGQTIQSAGGRGNIPQVFKIDVVPYKRVAATFSGPFAASIYNPAGTWSSGILWDPGLHCFLWYQDDGFLYTITRGATDADWIVDRLTVTGDLPPPDMSNGKHTWPTVYGLIQYVPNLHGVAMQLSCERNCYFIRTT